MEDRRYCPECGSLTQWVAVWTALCPHCGVTYTTDKLVSYAEWKARKPPLPIREKQDGSDRV